KDGKCKIWPVIGCGQLSSTTLPAGIGLTQVRFTDHTKNVICVMMPFFHPGSDVTTAGNLPFVDVGLVAECVQLPGNPKRPIAVASGVADKNIRHPTYLARASTTSACARILRTVSAISTNFRSAQARRHG